jgi:Spx/MgsR family transcriptional regulator
MLKIYVYQKCDRCRQALRWLDVSGIHYDAMPIRTSPPSVEELRSMLFFLDGRRQKLLNTTGKDYRVLNFKTILPDLSDEALFERLAENGNLIKRPFAIDEAFGLVGFKVDEWQHVFRQQGRLSSDE